MESPLFPCREALLEICDMYPGERLKASDGQGFKTSAAIPMAVNAGTARWFNHIAATGFLRRTFPSSAAATTRWERLKQAADSCGSEPASQPSLVQSSTYLKYQPKIQEFFDSRFLWVMLGRGGLKRVIGGGSWWGLGDGGNLSMISHPLPRYSASRRRPDQHCKGLAWNSMGCSSRGMAGDSWRYWAHRIVVDATQDRLEPSCWWAPLVYASLAGASVLYGAGRACVEAFYSAGILESKRLPVPVISVGNITWGGTGKTPMVILLAEMVAERGGKALVLSRGYGGDEDKMLASKLGRIAAVASGRDRFAAAVRALASDQGEGVTCVILDDGLQHHRIERDLHIVMVNCMSPWGSGALIPRGPLRVPLEEGVRMADLLVLHNGEAPGPFAPAAIFA